LPNHDGFSSAEIRPFLHLDLSSKTSNPRRNLKSQLENLIATYVPRWQRYFVTYVLQDASQRRDDRATF
jgi:hypothetical protein